MQYAKTAGMVMLLLLPVMAAVQTAAAQRPVKEYTLVLREKRLNKAGKPVQAITINDSMPGPTLYFTEGDSAVIHIRNEMSTESSVHWHGILIPNYYDGVAYLSTPPIAAGKTFTVRFPVRQTGTYWYHSHTMYQEQNGLFGALVMYPKKETRQYDREYVLLLSDWTNENPARVMNNLKRGLEWYAVKKGQAQSLNRVIARHGLTERIQMAWQRMPPMDISDVYYPVFLTNSDSVLRFPEARPGERLRLRVIDGSSSTFFHLQYAGGNMQIIAADGQDVEPVPVSRMLIGIAETYDLLVTVPENGSFEFRATAQDGSGYTSAYFGSGEPHAAPTLPRPDIFHMEGVMMQGMAGMKMKMGAMTMKLSKKAMEREMPYIQNAWLDREDLNMAGAAGMKMPGMHGEGMHDMPGMHNMQGMDEMDGGHDMHDMEGMHGMHHPAVTDSAPSGPVHDAAPFTYDLLRAPRSTAFDTAVHPLRQLTFDLTGSMWRYIWSINGRTLSEKDSIQVHEGEVLRITMNNQTMMYHPMHLHGHFFRVLNAQDSYSPLKHTVIVPPMRSVTIEFAADEPGDWFFHCHVLYHMMTGMARTFRYADYRAPDTMHHFHHGMLMNEDNRWFFWGEATAASGHGEGYLSYSNRKNWVQLQGDYGWSNRKDEITGTYERFVTRYLRPYAGVVLSNKHEYLGYYKDRGRALPGQDIRGVAGVRYLLPFFLNADLRIDNRAHVRFELSGETWLFPRVWLNYSVNTDKEFEVNLEGMLTRDLSVTGGYSSDYKWGGGLSYRF
ncbi:hypothetical protein GCM10023143_26110 [Compostibacter hankyongensis]|uniref:Copper oxidase n=1 Tax=Compostibacter hankyongensis TaxID=1007089 RepID=A0ABP8G0U0_9BACT